MAVADTGAASPRRGRGPKARTGPLGAPVSWPTAKQPAAHYTGLEAQTMGDHPSRPHHSPSRTPQPMVRSIVQLRVLDDGVPRQWPGTAWPTLRSSKRDDLEIRDRCCQRNSPGAGHTSSGSSGRSAQPHQTCQLAHFHNDRHIRRPSSSRSERTKPPDFMGWPHSGHVGPALVMRGTLTRDRFAPKRCERLCDLGPELP